MYNLHYVQLMQKVNLLNEERHQLFHDGGCYHIESSPLICSANLLRASFYMITASVIKELKYRCFQSLRIFCGLRTTIIFLFATIFWTN